MSVAPYDDPSKNAYNQGYNQGYSDPMQQQQMHQQPMGGQQQQTVIMMQPGAGGGSMGGMPPKREWSTGICGCFDDIGWACFAWFMPCCALMSLSSEMEETCCLPLCLPEQMSILALRVKIRNQSNIQGSILKDCCVVNCCMLCAMCQLHREWANVKALRAAGQSF